MLQCLITLIRLVSCGFGDLLRAWSGVRGWLIAPGGNNTAAVAEISARSSRVEPTDKNERLHRDMRMACCSRVHRHGWIYVLSTFPNDRDAASCFAVVSVCVSLFPI